MKVRASWWVLALLLGCAGSQEELEYGDDEDEDDEYDEYDQSSQSSQSEPDQPRFIDCPGAVAWRGPGDFTFTFEAYNQEVASEEIKSHADEYESETQMLQALDVTYVLNENSLPEYTAALLGSGDARCTAGGRSFEGCIEYHSAECDAKRSDGRPATFDVALQWQQGGENDGFYGNVRMNNGNGINTYFRFYANMIYDEE